MQRRRKEREKEFLPSLALVRWDPSFPAYNLDTVEARWVGCCWLSGLEILRRGVVSGEGVTRGRLNSGLAWNLLVSRPCGGRSPNLDN